MRGKEASERRRRRKWRRRMSVLCAWVAVILSAAALLSGALFYLRLAGRNRLLGRTEGQAPSLRVDPEGDGAGAGAGRQPGDVPGGDGGGEAVAWKEGWVRYGGKVYEYNTDLMNFLVMGIDKDSEVTENPDAYSGGQADALFLVSADRGRKELSVIAINRDTEVDVKLFDVHAEGYEQTVKAQIAVQHSFGDGKEFSCELTRDAVSSLFYGLPINGYVSVNMAAVAELNDAVGGVELTVLEDLTKKKAAWEEGARVTLKGEDAFWYVKWRDTSVFESNRGRLARQEQYLGSFLTQAKEAVRQDLTLPVTLYRKLKRYIVTDLSVDEMTYLAGELAGYSFDLGGIHTLEGHTEVVEGHERFYPDDEALKGLMVRLFYRETDAG